MQARAVRPVQVALESPGQLWVGAPTSGRPLEEVARRASLATNVQRVCDQCAVAVRARERAGPVVMLRDDEDASRIQARDRGAIGEVGDAGYHPGPRGSAKRREVEVIRPPLRYSKAGLGHHFAKAALPRDLGFLSAAKGGAQAVVDRGQPALDLETGGVAGKDAQHIGAADVLQVVFPAAAAKAPLPVAQNDHGVNRPVDELEVEMRTFQPDQAAVTADSGQDAAVPHRAGKT